MNAFPIVFVRTSVPEPLQTPVWAGNPLLELLLPLLVLPVVGLLPLLVLPVVVLPPVPPVPGLALPVPHADPSAKAHPAVKMDTCHARIRFIVSPRPCRFPEM
jgi:hypothetical protein